MQKLTTKYVHIDKLTSLHNGKKILSIKDVAYTQYEIIIKEAEINYIGRYGQRIFGNFLPLAVN